MPAAGQGRQEFACCARLALHDLGDVGGNISIDLARRLVRDRRRDVVGLGQRP